MLNLRSCSPYNPIFNHTGMLQIKGNCQKFSFNRGNEKFNTILKDFGLNYFSNKILNEPKILFLPKNNGNGSNPENGNKNNSNNSLMITSAIVLAGIALFLISKEKFAETNTCEESEIEEPTPLKEFEISSSFTIKEFKLHIEQLVKAEKKDEILELIKLINKKDIFKTIPEENIFIEQYPNLCEIEISTCIIENRKIDLIRDIFPHLREFVLSGSRVYYDPIKNGDIELVKALKDGGIKIYSDSVVEKPDDFLLHSILYNQQEMADYIFNNFGYDDINASLPFRLYLREAMMDQHKCGGYITPAYLAASLNDVKMLQWLIKNGADCNTPNYEPIKPTKFDFYHGITPLNAAIASSSYDCYNVIIKQKNIDLDAKNVCGKTALMISLGEKKYEIAKSLIYMGANVNIADPKGNTPLMFAVAFGENKMVKDLIKAGADSRCVNENGKNLWHHVFSVYHPKEFSMDICNFLLAQNINDMIDQPDKLSGKTPLAGAIDDANLLAVDWLLSAGANPNANINLSAYSRKEYSLPKNGDISPLVLAKAALEDTKKSSLKYPEESAKIEKYEKIIDLLESYQRKL